jgi:hypothetical protein
LSGAPIVKPRTAFDVIVKRLRHWGYFSAACRAASRSHAPLEELKASPRILKNGGGAIENEEEIRISDTKK